MVENNEFEPAVGKSIPRIDGRAKVCGEALYVDDLSKEGCLHGRTLRSEIPHGILKSITPDPDFDWSSFTIVTAGDIPGENVITLMGPDQPALVPIGGTIKHQDEPLALLAGPSKEAVAHALAHLHVEVIEHTPVLTLEESLAGDTIIYGEDNVLKRFVINKGDDVEKAFAEADHIVEGIYTTGAQEQMYIEPQGMLAYWEGESPDDQRVFIKGSMQCPYYIHTALKPILGLEDEGVVVSQAVTGGGFGGKEEYPSILAAHAALLSLKSQRPVKMIYDRAEDIGATTKRHPSRVHHRMGLKKDGSIVAIDVDVLIDGGAYLTLTPVVLSRAILHAAGPYRCDNIRIVGRAMATNAPPHGAYRGFGAPQVTFAYERQAEKASRVLGMEPLRFRQLNTLRLDDTTATGQRLTYSVAGEQVLAKVQEQLEQPAPKERRTLGNESHIRRGRGWSFCYHGAGFTGSGEERMKAQVAVALTEKGTFEVRSASTDIGQGAITIFTQMAASTLGVSTDLIKVCVSQTDLVPNSGPTVASRTCMVVGSIVEKAAQKVLTKLTAYADEQGLANKSILEVARSYAEAHGELEEMATYKSPPGIHFDDETYTGDAYPVFGWSCSVVDVAIDTDTFEVTLERCVHAIDVGKAIHPIIVKGQIEGGTLQALGWALWENVVYQNGRVMNRRMTDSIIPTFIDAPEMETIIVEEHYPHGPHGAKGVGEIPMDGPAAAVANAIEDAIGDLLRDNPPDCIPLLPETIQALVSGKEGGPWLCPNP